MRTQHGFCTFASSKDKKIVIQVTPRKREKERPPKGVVIRKLKKQRKEKVMSMMTFITIAAVMFVGASALALVMNHMVEGAK